MLFRLNLISVFATTLFTTLIVVLLVLGIVLVLQVEVEVQFPLATVVTICAIPARGKQNKKQIVKFFMDDVFKFTVE